VQSQAGFLDGDEKAKIFSGNALDFMGLKESDFLVDESASAAKRRK
jgi:hypothetical protein